MKKILTFLLCAITLVTAAACTDSMSVNETIDEKETYEEPSTDKSNTTEEQQPLKKTETDKKSEVEFAEKIVVDNEECAIRITKLKPDSLFGYTLQVNLENKSSETTYAFDVEHCSVNDVECTAFLYEDVAPGKKANASITLTDDALKKNGIKEFTDIELVFTVKDSDDWSADDIVNETVHIYPYGEDKADSFTRESKNTDIVIADTEQAKVTVIGYENDPIWGYTVNLYIENKCDKSLSVSIDEASVNGYMADPFFATSVRAGKKDFAGISWSDTTLEENDITDIEEIEFLLKVYDSDNWFADRFVEEIITLNP